ncbi:(2Fe-2S)-binding protein [Pacificimonas sp. WHA3]|uniref:(2Fe-2S)-binding protein n=1 Tax=Pacificimonas pallii TaxID=2827236 RepID=A0ABS6SHH2_9SPHN|nr:(2Fe-2S)-binding protein [Pacificimonas pallii]MBV7257493.1 (2Fe-2S)-binding protein [Pacificimonas pallii]
MAKRIHAGVVRGDSFTLFIDDIPVTAFEGETLATCLILSGKVGCSTDREGNRRGPFCNMGVCYDCLVAVTDDSGSDQVHRVRACLTPARPGQRISTCGSGQPE